MRLLTLLSIVSGVRAGCLVTPDEHGARPWTPTGGGGGGGAGSGEGGGGALGIDLGGEGGAPRGPQSVQSVPGEAQ